MIIWVTSQFLSYLFLEIIQMGSGTWFGEKQLRCQNLTARVNEGLLGGDKWLGPCSDESIEGGDSSI